MFLRFFGGGPLEGAQKIDVVYRTEICTVVSTLGLGLNPKSWTIKPQRANTLTSACRFSMFRSWGLGFRV